MSDDCVIVGSKGDTSPIGSPPLKKLKQSRLPFSPINTKSPKQNESEKKRKHSGSDDSTSTPKTPRSEIRETVSPDENKLSVKAEESAAKPKSPEEEKKAKEVLKRRGRPVGSKNKLKDDSFSSPQGDASSPVARKRGRPGKSSSDLNRSLDLNKSIQDEEEKPASDKKSEAEIADAGETSSAKADKEDCGSPGISESRNKEELQLSSGKDKSSKNEKQDESVKGNEKEDSSTNVKSLDCSEEGKSGEVVVKKRGRPKQSLSPQDEDKPKRKRGRPKGSKNIQRHGSQSSLNQSLCSNPSDDESSNSLSSTPVFSKDKEKPVEKTRKLLGLFASPNLMVKKEVRKIKDMFIRERGESTSGSEKKADVKRHVREECKKKEIPASTGEGKEEECEAENLPEVKKGIEKEQTISKHGEKEKGLEEGETSKERGEKEKENQDSKVVVEKETKTEDNLAKDKVIKESVEEVDENSVSGPNDEKTAEANESKDLDEEETKEEDKSRDLDGSINESKDLDGSINKSKDLDESVNDMDTSTCESESNTSKTQSLDKSNDADKSTLSESKTPVSAGRKLSFTKPKKLTPKQKEKEAAKLLRLEEKVKQQRKKQKELEEKNAEKERKRKEREEEKQKKKEEIEKLKEELRRKRQEENDAKKQKKEELLQKKEEERLKKEEEKLKREEERLKKEEEKQKKVEEQQKKEEEKRMKNDMLKNKFASFFVSKKREFDDDEKESEGPFKEFRVKEDMQLAPIVRRMLSDSQITELDNVLSSKHIKSSITYLTALKSESYVKGGSEKTWPCKRERQGDDEDDVMIVDEDDEDDDIGDCSAMIQDPSANTMQGKQHKAKLLLFCENRRPAYWGTWSKKSSLVSARRPFAKEEIFDYDEDSDDDWEEEEAGESLSDSEGEDKEEEKEKEDQYEVDNDFFVPHGYLSDDEGKSDQEEEEEEDASKSKDTERSKTTEQLKLKQAEFEEEMKKKTKALKPRLIGCLWMADQNNNPAYDQLMKILGPHKAVTLCSQLPIGKKRNVSDESKEAEGDEDCAADFRTGNSKKFVKTFPEEAVPALIKLLHGNRHGKTKLCREFGDYWRKLTGGELEESLINVTPVKTPVSGSVHISKRKVEYKIQELGKWKRCLDESISRHIMCWYVPRNVREEYGVTDLELTNNWIYVNNPVKEKKEDLGSDEETPKINKLRPITAFTKKIPSTPSSTNTSPSSTPSTTPLNKRHPKDEGSSPSLNGFPADAMSKTPVASRTGGSTAITPSSASAVDGSLGKPQPLSGNKNKKKANLFPVKSQEAKGPPQKGSIVSFFKKNKEMSPQTEKRKSNDSAKESGSAKEEEIVVLD